MLRHETLLRRTDQRMAFLQGFLRHPREVGSVTPSSRFLERRIVESAGVANAMSVVELGPGTGGTTCALLRAMPSQAKLLAIELDAEFAEMLLENQDPRLYVEKGSAERIERAIADHGLARPQVVVSGIPFSTMGAEVGRRIIEAVREVVAPGGLFVAYQLRRTVAELAVPILGEPEVDWELLNVPPIRVFRWRF